MSIRHKFRLADQVGAESVTRGQGEKLRARLENALADLAPNDRLEIDFSGVDVMTPSFADECFGKLAENVGAARFRDSISLVGANATVRTLVNSILAERLSARHHNT